ncbi:MAG: chemotaxis protein CheD [Bacillota bacterium]
MSVDEIRVKMAEYAIMASPGLLVTIGLGSCVGIALYDSRSKIGGLIHIMLPENKKKLKPAKYADTGIPLMISEMVKKGASKNRLIAKIAGGAQMFSMSGGDSSLNVGERNVNKVKEVLAGYNIKIAGEDVGKNYGRTMKFYTEDGKVLITSHHSEDNIL